MIERAMAILHQLDKLGVQAKNLCADSRQVVAGDVFVAFPGTRVDGRRFMAEVVKQGAAAVLWERRGGEGGVAVDELNTVVANIAVPNIGVDDLQGLSGYLAHLVYGRPTEKLRTIGVTGTNGKTSISQWIACAFEMLGTRCAVVGTLGNGFPGNLHESANTTPDAITLHRLFARYLAEGARAAAMEVSSIGMDQGRVNGVHFDIAVFTNLTRDHLEYHGSMAGYAEAKKKLFRTPVLRVAVLNLDDPLGRELCGDLAGSGVRRIGYTLRTQPNDASLVDVLIAARDITATSKGVAFQVTTPQAEVEVQASLVGEFNVANLLAVLGALLASDVPLVQAAEVLGRLTPPPGRMQTLGGDRAPLAVVDYAHTPDALEKALTALRETARVRGGRLVCVVGCGGERDPGKRPLMGEIAARLSDVVVLTSDNPRGEDPLTILTAVAQGAPAARIIADRAAAIRETLHQADARDVVLIAGKGHETYQESAGQRLPFSDVVQAEAVLTARGLAP